MHKLLRRIHYLMMIYITKTKLELDETRISNQLKKDCIAYIASPDLFRIPLCSYTMHNFSLQTRKHIWGFSALLNKMPSALLNSTNAWLYLLLLNPNEQETQPSYVNALFNIYVCKSLKSKAIISSTFMTALWIPFIHI